MDKKLYFVEMAGLTVGKFGWKKTVEVYVEADDIQSAEKIALIRLQRQWGNLISRIYLTSIKYLAQDADEPIGGVAFCRDEDDGGTSIQSCDSV